MVKKQKESSDIILDGVLVKKGKNFFDFLVESENKKKKIILDSKTSFTKMKLTLPDKVISQTKIKWESIKKGDSLSLIVNKEKKGYLALSIRQIVVD